jgi:hypothetical protein
VLKVLLVVIIFAALVYWLISTLDRRRVSGPPRPERRPDPTRQVAPDDDEDFLRSLRRRGNDPEK